jgi:hypothetical protein
LPRGTLELTHDYNLFKLLECVYPSAEKVLLQHLVL